MIDKDQNQQYTSISPFPAGLTALTTEIFTANIDQFGESFDLSKEYLCSELTNKSEILTQMQANSIKKIEKNCDAYLVKLAFYAIYEGSVKTIQMNEEEKRNYMHKSLYKMELIFYRKIRVRLQISFSKLMKFRKTHEEKPNLPKKSGMKRIMQILQCEQSKKSIELLNSGFKKLKKHSEFYEKLQILTVVLDEIQNRKFNERKAFEKIKENNFMCDRLEICIKTVEIIFNNLLHYSFNKMKIQHQQGKYQIDDENQERQNDFFHANLIDEEKIVQKHVGKKSYLREKPLSPDPVRVNKFIKNIEFWESDNSTISKTEKTPFIRILPSKTINMKFSKINQQIKPLMQDLPFNSIDEKKRNFGEFNRIQYSRPQQFLTTVPDQCTFTFIKEDFAVIFMPNYKKPSKASPQQNSRTKVKKKMKKLSNEKRNLATKNMQAVKIYYFPDKQEPEMKQKTKNKSRTKKSKNKSITINRGYSPESQKVISSRVKPTSASKEKKQLKVKTPKEWEIYKPNTTKLSHDYFEYGKNPKGKDRKKSNLKSMKNL